MKETCFS